MADAEPVGVRSWRWSILALLVMSPICLALAPFALPEGYDPIRQTTSEAAAQSTPGAWLARTGLVIFGITVLVLVYRRSDLSRTSRALHSTFGVMLITAAVFSHRPYLEGIPADDFEDLLHSIAATAMGFAFAGGVVSVAWQRRPEWFVVDLLALVASFAIPLMMVVFPSWAGLLQRLMFVFAYVWFAREAIVGARRSVVAGG